MVLEKKFIIVGYLLVLIVLFATIAGIFEQFIFFVKILPFLILFSFIVFISLSILKIKNFSLKKFITTYKYDLLVFFFLIIFCFVNASFYHETISGSRDDGIYSMNAVYLAQHGTNSIRFFPQVAKLLEKPGNLGFLPGYHSYLAIFMYYFGLKNMLMFANALLYLFSISCIYLVGKNLYGRKIAIISTLFFITNYVSLWFSRRTNNENLGLFLFWFIVLLLINIIKNKNFKYFIFLIPTLIAFFFIRGESLLLIIPILFISFIISIKNRFKINKRSLDIKNYFSLFFITNLLIVVISIYSFGFYYKNNRIYFEENAKSIKGVMTVIIRRNGLTAIRDLKLAANVYNYSPPVIQDFTVHAPRYVFDVLKAYFLIQFLFLGLISIRKINLNLIVIVAMSSPFFAFLIYPAITPDNPWMMRKYWIAFIPFVYIIFGYFLKSSFFERRIKILTILLLFTIQLSLSLPVLTFAENRGLIDSLDKLVKKMPNADLIITPKTAQAGWYYPIWIYYNIPSQMEYANKNFQNTLNFENMISKFNNVYLITTSWNYNDRVIAYNNFSYPKAKFREVDKITIPIINLSPVGSELVENREYTYDFVKDIIKNLLPKNITNEKTELIILKLEP